MTTPRGYNITGDSNSAELISEQDDRRGSGKKTRCGFEPGALCAQGRIALRIAKCIAFYT